MKKLIGFMLFGLVLIGLNGCGGNTIEEEYVPMEISYLSDSDLKNAFE